jgi:hypothetical protein
MRSMALFLKYKFIFAITIFIALILGNQVPVYPFDNHTNHGTHGSVQNQKNASMEDNGVSGNNSSKSYAEQIMAYCQDGNEHCPMMALDELNKTASRQAVLGTFSDLNLLYDKSNYSCHHEGHHLGWWLYDYTKDLKEALNYATLLCGGSNFHGIFQSYFEREHQVHNVDKNQIKIAHLCPIGQENVNWMHERDCIHGIGHGLAKLYSYNTTAAVDRCNEFMPLWAQSACSRGIFMENNDHFLETGKGDFDNNDIYSPCDRIVEKFAPQCYYYHPMHLSERNNHSLTDTYAQCDNISPDKFVKYCYEGMGRKLQLVAYTNPEQAIAYCYQGNQPAYHDDCLTGTLKTMLKGDAKTDTAFKFCSLSNLDFKSECYQIVGMWIKAFLYPNLQELERECSKAPDIDYVTDCINASKETSMQASVFEPL